VTQIYLDANISKTEIEARFQIGNAYGKSIGHVISDITWPRKMKIVTSVCLVATSLSQKSDGIGHWTDSVFVQTLSCHNYYVSGITVFLTSTIKHMHRITDTCNCVTKNLHIHILVSIMSVLCTYTLKHNWTHFPCIHELASFPVKVYKGSFWGGWRDIFCRLVPSWHQNLSMPSSRHRTDRRC